MKTSEQAQVAEVGYSKEGRELQVTLPHGTRMADLTKVLEFLARDVFSKLPRGCTACHSGDHLIIREQLENVIRVDLNQKAILK
jgi:urease accessory protein UreE